MTLRTRQAVEGRDDLSCAGPHNHIALWLYVSDSWSCCSTTLLQSEISPKQRIAPSMNCHKMLYKHSWFQDDEVYQHFLQRHLQVDLDMSDGLP